MRVLICGGRDMDRTAAFNWLERNLKDELAHETGCFSALTIERVIHGGARGADDAAGQWAESEGVPVTVYRAQWEKHGNAAGPLRNQKMIEEGKPDVVVALPGGRGTADMVRRAKDAGVKVIEVQI
jgi:hypothetical protein